MSDSNIDENTVRRLAKLAALALDDGEVAQMSRELSAIVRHVDLLMTVDVSEVPATTQVMLQQLTTRPDEPRPSLSQADALAEAPRALDGAFAVPSYLDEG